jgi:diguanylate cyclase (GGDEF)-like protein
MEAHVALGVSLLVALSLGAVLLATTRAVTSESRGRAASDLEAGRASLERLLEARAESSAALTRLITELPVFRAHVSDPRVVRDAHTMDEMTDRYRRQLGAAFCVVTDRNGESISRPGWPEARASPASLDEAIAASLDGSAQRRIVTMGHQLFLVVIEPIRFADEVLGAMAVAHALDDAVADEMAKAASIQVNLVTGVRLSGSSLDAHGRAELERMLLEGDEFQDSRGVSPKLRDLGRDRYVEGIFPLSEHASADPSARLVLLEDWRPTREFLAALRRQIAGAAGVIFVLALAGAVVFSRRTSRPVREIAVAARDIAAGNWARQVPVCGSAEAVTMAEAFNAMSASLRATQERLLHDAFHDPLTHLPNRALFMDRLHRAFTRRSRYPDYTFAVLFIDLDRFKTVNDSIGHPAGDKLLLEIAERLTSALRDMDTVARADRDTGTPRNTLARVGGDEFTILLEELTEAGDAVRIAERLQRAVSVPISLAGQEVFTSASIGITVASASHRSGDDLIRDADIAMYRAKTAGGACAAIFDASMHQRIVQQMQLETDLRHAIERGEFRLHYEPIVELHTARIIGYEALLRWQHREQGLLSPTVFLQVAEETGLMPQIDEWVLHQACRDASWWQTALPFGAGLSVSVNVSASGFSQPDFVSRVGKALRESGLRPRDLRLEVTESAAMREAERSTAIMTELRELGVRISLDDFGTGYSSLSYLQRFPVDTLKIDRSFVLGLSRNDENREIVRTIVNLGRTLKLDVIAEGTETADQIAYLDNLQCGFGQGYFFSRPVPVEELGSLTQIDLSAIRLVASSA